MTSFHITRLLLKTMLVLRATAMNQRLLLVHWTSKETGLRALFGTRIKSNYGDAIQLNEETKYRASTDRGSLKADIIAEINDNFRIAGADTKAGRRLKTMLDNFYYENISFDSGVGSIEKSIETGDAQAWEHTFAVDISMTIGVGIGLDGWFWI